MVATEEEYQQWWLDLANETLVRRQKDYVRKKGVLTLWEDVPEDQRTSHQEQEPAPRRKGNLRCAGTYTGWDGQFWHCSNVIRTPEVRKGHWLCPRCAHRTSVTEYTVPNWEMRLHLFHVAGHRRDGDGRLIRYRGKDIKNNRNRRIAEALEAHGARRLTSSASDSE